MSPRLTSDDPIFEALKRLSANAQQRREALQRIALRKAGRRQTLTIFSGVLALTSAGTIATVLTRLFGTPGFEAVAALVAAISGTITLVVNAHYADDAIVTMLIGSARYLALRDSAHRLTLFTDSESTFLIDRLEEMELDYARLDETYSKYFPADPEYSVITGIESTR